MQPIVLTPFGSSGDVFPFIALGRQLRAAGHPVTIVTASLFRLPVEQAGLRFIPVGEDAQFECLIRDKRIWKLGFGTKAVFEHAARFADLFFHALQSLAQEHPPPAVILSPVLAFGSRAAREAFGIPLISVHLQPAVFLSAHDTPVLFPTLAPILQRLPPKLKRWLFDHAPNPVDAFAGPILRPLLAKVGVAPPASFFRQWWDSPDGVLALFPKWFARPQPDWPQPLLQIGFPLEDLAHDQPLPTQLRAFLNRHTSSPPIVFTAGSANVQAHRFFAEATTALHILQRPGIFLTRDLGQLPAVLPPTIHAEIFAPFGRVLTQSSAFVHHGGIGTLSQGFAAGIPQLLMPMAHDQPDNARRLQHLGGGAVLTPRQFRGPRIAATLQHLLTHPTVRDACQHLRHQIQADIHATPAWIEWTLQRAATANPRLTK